MKKSALWGLLTGIAVWIPLIAADAVDELLLDESLEWSAAAFLLMPFVMLVLYIVHYIRKKPRAKQILVWLGCYLLTFLPLWGWLGGSEGNVIIPQGRRSDFLDFNGVEYIWYGYAVQAAFWVLIVLFHVIYAAVCYWRQRPAGGDIAKS